MFLFSLFNHAYLSYKIVRNACHLAVSVNTVRVLSPSSLFSYMTSYQNDDIDNKQAVFVVDRCVMTVGTLTRPYTPVYFSYPLTPCRCQQQTVWNELEMIGQKTSTDSLDKMDHQKLSQN